MAKLSGCLKAGVVAGVGCLSIAAVAVVGLIVAATWARTQLNERGDTRPVRSERVIALPGSGGGGAGTPPAAPQGRSPMRLTIELQEGVFTVRPGAAGSGVHVEGTWAPGLYALTETVDEAAAGGVPEATIRFGSTGPAWMRVLGGMFDGGNDQPRVSVTIPRDVALDLTLQVGMGTSEIDLGGLTLGALDLALSMGEHRVDFTEPLRGGMRRLDLSASMGDVEVERIGNTRAQVIEASGSMGNLTVDLGGGWTASGSTQVSFAQSMGELTVRVPTTVRLETSFQTSMGDAQRREAAEPQTDDPDAALLRLHVSTSMAETRVVRY